MVSAENIHCKNNNCKFSDKSTFSFTSRIIWDLVFYKDTNNTGNKGRWQNYNFCEVVIISKLYFYSEVTKKKKAISKF